MSDNDDEESIDQDFAAAIKKNSRKWLGYWSWADKPVMERNAVQAVLTASGMQIEGLRSREPGQDPPDCEAYVSGKWSGIEVVELVHQSTLERSLKALKQRKSGKEPIKTEAYFAYEREDLLRDLQKLITAKDTPTKIKGGPYDTYILVIVTDEFYLYEQAVIEFLEGATFKASFINEAYLGLSYHPSEEPNGGRYPSFKLSLFNN